MMEGIGNYLISLVAAALICGILVALSSGNKSGGPIIKMLCGIFMALTMIAPLAKLQIQDLGSYMESIDMDGKQIAAEASSNATKETAQIIKQELEAYIMDKADSMNIQIQVQIILDEGALPKPASVILKGDISPYNRQVLTEFIEKDIGIQEAQQRWN